MKKTLSILIIALAFLSCEKEKTGPTHDTTPIEFGNVETRAVVESVETMKDGGGFGVFAYLNGGTGAESIYSSILENEKVYWVPTEGAWAYDDVKYWTSGRNYHFFAYYPYNGNESAISDVTVVQDGTGNCTGNRLTFTTPADANVDLMTASATVDTSKPSYSKTVPMTFNHELVQVNVIVEQDFEKNPAGDRGTEFCVNSIILSNIRKKGTLTVSGLGDGATNTWTYDASEAPMEFKYSEPEDKPISTLDGKVVRLSDNDLILIPQATGSINLAMTYKYGTYVDGNIVWEPRSANVNLPAGTWKAGTKVTYSISLYQDKAMVFVKVTVAGWGTNQSGGTIIIK